MIKRLVSKENKKKSRFRTASANLLSPVSKLIHVVYADRTSRYFCENGAL